MRRGDHQVPFSHLGKRQVAIITGAGMLHHVRDSSWRSIWHLLPLFLLGGAGGEEPHFFATKGRKHQTVLCLLTGRPPTMQKSVASTYPSSPPGGYNSNSFVRSLPSRFSFPGEVAKYIVCFSLSFSSEKRNASSMALVRKAGNSPGTQSYRHHRRCTQRACETRLSECLLVEPEPGWMGYEAGSKNGPKCIDFYPWPYDQQRKDGMAFPTLNKSREHRKHRK